MGGLTECSRAFAVGEETQIPFGNDNQEGKGENKKG